MKKRIGQGNFLRLVKDGKWEFVERTNASGVVAVVAVTRDRRIVLTDQFRPAVGRNVIDLPAGLAGDTDGMEDEAFAESALRELIEETGYEAKRLKPVAECASSPGLTSEVVSVFVATGLKKCDVGGGVDGEKIVVHTPPLRGIDGWLAKRVAMGALIDGKVYSGLYFAHRHFRQTRTT